MPCLSVRNIFSLMLALISYSHVMRNNDTRQVRGETLMAWFYFYFLEADVTLWRCDPTPMSHFRCLMLVTVARVCGRTITTV